MLMTNLVAVKRFVLISYQLSFLFKKSGKKKFLTADYTQKFVESIISNSENNKIESVEDGYIIPPEFFDIAGLVITIEVLFVPKMRFP